MKRGKIKAMTSRAEKAQSRILNATTLSEWNTAWDESAGLFHSITIIMEREGQQRLLDTDDISPFDNEQAEIDI